MNEFKESHGKTDKWKKNMGEPYPPESWPHGVLCPAPSSAPQGTVPALTPPSTEAAQRAGARLSPGARWGPLPANRRLSAARPGTCAQQALCKRRVKRSFQRGATGRALALEPHYPGFKSNQGSLIYFPNVERTSSRICACFPFWDMDNGTDLGVPEGHLG